MAKGQLSTIDAMVGLAGIIMVFMLSAALFSTLYGKISSSMGKKEMEISSYYALEQLLSDGDPANWHTLSTFNNFGLEKGIGVLDADKVAALNSSIAANYSFVKERLGISKYNFSVEVMDYYNRSHIHSMGSANSSDVISMQRISTLNNSLVIVQFKVAK